MTKKARNDIKIAKIHIFDNEKIQTYVIVYDITSPNEYEYEYLIANRTRRS